MRLQTFRFGLVLGWIASTLHASQPVVQQSAIAGGGTSLATDGTHLLSGTIGQAFASGPSIAGGGQIKLASGFWWTVDDCPADFNNDGMVNDEDFEVFVASYNELVIPPANPICDLNHDQYVDDVDFQVFILAYETLVCP